MRLNWKLGAVSIALTSANFGVISAVAGNPAAIAPETGIYRLESRKIYDSKFDPKSIPELVYWYQEVDATVKGAKFGVVGAAANRLGSFIKMKVKVGDQDLPNAERYTSEAKWKVGITKEGPADIVILNQEKILRLFDKDLDHPLVDFAMTRLGLDQREAAVALKIDTTQFPITTYLAHRGVARIPLLNKRGMFPGNTMESMAHALWNGFPGFEIDIQVTKDNVLVVSHDGKLGTSTDCKGKISDTLVDDVTKCRVLYTGVVPDLALFHNKAAIPSTIPTLKKVLDTYLPDPRLKHVVLDVKPGNIDVQTPAFAEILHSYPKDQTSKIIFLMRSTTMIHRLQAVEGDTTPIFAREQSKGWEDLEKAAEGKSKEEIFSELNEDEATVTQNENASFDKDDALTTAVDAAADGALNRASDGEPNAVTPAKPPAKVSLSLSLGLGLGLAGLSDHHKGSTLIAIFNILKVVPRVVTRLAQHMFGNGSVEIDLISWSKRNEQALRTLTDAAAQDQRQIVGWTVNSKEKIGWLRANSPKLDFILSDLPYRRIMALQLAELTTALSASALSTTP